MPMKPIQMKVDIDCKFLQNLKSTYILLDLQINLLSNTQIGPRTSTRHTTPSSIVREILIGKVDEVITTVDNHQMGIVTVEDACGDA